MFVAKRLLLAGLAMLMIAGCASTSLTQQWKEPTYTGPAFKKILVIGATDSPTNRRTFETEFSIQLDKQANVDGVPSYSVLPAEGEIDREEIARVVVEQGIDAVLITRVIGTEQTVQYSGGMGGYPGYYGGMYDYYYGAYSSPGYVTTSTTVRLETNVYAVSTEKLTWAGITETFAPSNLEREVQELAGVLIKSMSQSGLL